MFGWFRRAREVEQRSDEHQPVAQACPGIARVLERIFGSGKQPEVLDLGQHSGSPALYLADRGARVCVERFELPPTEVAAVPAEPPPPKPAVRIPQPDAKFDLVLAWEHGDFIPPDRLDEFMAELRRVMAPGGFLVLFSQDRPASDEAAPDRPSCYRLEADDRILLMPSRGPQRPRWAYPNRAIERALAPLAVCGIHLHWNRMREVIARKPAS